MLKPSIVVLDVGHGNSTIVLDPGGVVIVDAGRGGALTNFLKQENIHEIRDLLISHSDVDHIEGAAQLLAMKDLKVQNVYLNSDARQTSVAWDDFNFALSNHADQGKLCHNTSLEKSMTGRFDLEHFNLEILYPNGYLASRGPGSTDRKGRALTSNSLSVVIRIVDKNGTPVILTSGDLDEIGLDNMLQDGNKCVADVLIFPHHGGKGSGKSVGTFVRRICKATKPSTVIFSIGRGKYGTPHPDVVAQVKRVLPKSRIVCTQLSENCARIIPNPKPGHLASKYCHGRESNHCCAGSLIIEMDNESRYLVTPSAVDHGRFVRKNIPDALCMMRTSRQSKPEVRHHRKRSPRKLKRK